MKKVQSKVASATTQSSIARVEKKKTSKRDKVIEKVTPINNASLIEDVISKRKVKYIYPDDVTDTLSRKAYRQKIRAELDSLEIKMLRLKDSPDTKAYKDAKKKYDTRLAQVMK